VYKLSKNVVLETFDDGALILILQDRRLIELNPSAAAIISLMDGQRTPEQAAIEISKNHDISHDYPFTQINQDVLELCERMKHIGVFELRSDLKERRAAIMTASDMDSFLQNPDVVLREEDPEEGALLFNPDNGVVKVINTTGMFIWQQCGDPRTLGEIISEVQKSFDDVPLEKVDQDVREFMDSMLASGFIGTVEKSVH
jgi:hypothetical protein